MVLRKWMHKIASVKRRETLELCQASITYTMVAKSDVQLKIESYSFCEERFLFILSRK